MLDPINFSIRTLALAAVCGWPVALPGQTQEVSQVIGDFQPQGPVLGGAAAAIDKSHFNLFKPTPSEHLRDMNALFNGPYTVDAGYVQLETVAVLYSYDHDTAGGADSTTKYFSFGSTALRLGLLNNVDVGATIAPHIRVRTRDRVSGASTTQNGFGDVTLRAKINLWGNDGGSTAFGLSPFLKLPTNQDGLGNRYVEGGLGLPLAIELPWEWWLGVTPEFHCFHNVSGGGCHLNFASTAFLWHKIAGDFSGYIESSNWISTERGSPWISTVDLGLTYVWGTHVQLDAGAYIGVTRAAADITPFLGISFRF